MMRRWMMAMVISTGLAIAAVPGVAWAQDVVDPEPVGVETTDFDWGWLGLLGLLGLAGLAGRNRHEHHTAPTTATTTARH